MPGVLKKKWPLFAVLIVFTICKLPHLHYAYYWDESWPYAVAIRDMYNHGISLLPTAIDGELSRGHPLFFHALAALWMKIFGPSHVSMHSFALTISLLFLATIYEAGLRTFNMRMAILAILLVATQMIFFVQSSFVLFDMLVAFLSFFCIYLYTSRRYVLTAIFLTVLFYTKESGFIAGFIIGMDSLFSLANKSESLRLRISRLAVVAVPCVLAAVFFIIQKQVRGWYILPLYNNLIERRWDSFWYGFRINCLLTTIVRDYRYYELWLLPLFAVIASVKNKNAWYLSFIPPAVIIYYCVDDARAGKIMPGIPFFILFILSLVFMVYTMLRLQFFDNIRQKKFTILLLAFTFCFLCFSAMNFFTPRYMLATIVPVLFFAAASIDTLSRRTHPWAFYPVIAVVAVVTWYNFKTTDDFGDCGTGAFRAMDVEQHVVDYFEQHNDHDKNIGCLFLNSRHLADPSSGFLHSGKAFPGAQWTMDGHTDFAVFDNIENDGRIDMIRKDPSYHLIYRYQNGSVWTEIYGRTK